MANTIKFKRGTEANLPILNQGEPAYCTDNDKTFIGDGAANHEFVMHDLFDANTILAANTDNTPVALTVAEQSLLGRITGGNISALTVAQVNAMLGAFLADGSEKATGDFDMDNHAIDNVVLDGGGA